MLKSLQFDLSKCWNEHVFCAETLVLRSPVLGAHVLLHVVWEMSMWYNKYELRWPWTLEDRRRTLLEMYPVAAEDMYRGIMKHCAGYVQMHYVSVCH